MTISILGIKNTTGNAMSIIDRKTYIAVEINLDNRTSALQFGHSTHESDILALFEKENL